MDCRPCGDPLVPLHLTTVHGARPDQVELASIILEHYLRPRAISERRWPFSVNDIFGTNAIARCKDLQLMPISSFVEEGEQAVVMVLWDGIELVIVAPGADEPVVIGHRAPEEVGQPVREGDAEELAHRVTVFGEG